MSVFINFSNYPVAKWSQEQIDAAYKLADTDEDKHLIDVKFPKVPTDADFDEIEELAYSYFDRLLEIADKARGYERGYIDELSDPKSPERVFIMIQGEASLSCALVMLITNSSYYRHVIPVCATYERIAEKLPDGSIKRRCEFVRFRRYCQF